MEAKYHFIFIVVILILSLFIINFFFGDIEYSDFFGEKTCGDGTFYEQCSLRKPYYCSDGLLFERASICGCPEELNLSGELCLSEHQKKPIELNLKYILRGDNRELMYTAYSGMSDYLLDLPKSIDYGEEGSFSRVDFKLKAIEEPEQARLLEPLVVEIQNTINDEMEQVRIATSIVQNLEWGRSNRTINFGGFNLNYSRYPYEVLLDSQGLCGEKSELLAFLLKEMGYGVAIFYNSVENHESVGIKCPIEESWYDTGYCFIETSGPSIITDSSLEYNGGLKLLSPPQVMVISEGKALEKGLPEYKDADKMMKIRSRLNGNGFGFFEGFRLERLKAKYGLVDSYNLD